jgi:PAS domain S-box-containing protein
VPGNGRGTGTGGTPHAGGLPVPVLALTAALAAAAVAGAVAAARLSGPSAHSWTAAACFFLVLTAVGLIHLRFHYGDDVSDVDLAETVLLPTVLVLPGPVAVALVAGAKAVVELALRIHPVKACFNIAAYAAATAASCVAWAALHHGERIGQRNLLALVIALGAWMLVNAALLVVVLGLAQHRPPYRVAAALLPMMLPGSLLASVVNLTFGVLFLAIYPGSPLVALLLLLPIGMLHWASRAYAAVRADRTRLAGMQRAVSALAGPVDPREAIPQFLAEVRRCFEAEAADLVVLLDDSCMVHRSRGEPASSSHEVEALPDESLAAALLWLERPARVTTRSTDPALLAALARDGWRDCLAVPLREGGATIGLLCTYNRGGLEGFEDGELAVLEALGGEISAALRKGDLLQEVFEQRTKLEEIVTHTSDGIATLDPDGTVMSWNPAFEQMTGYSASDVVGGQGLSRLRPRTPQGREVLLERWTDERIVLPEVLEVLTPRGRPCWLACAYTRVPAAGPAAAGRYHRLVLTCHDITKEFKLRRAEQELRRSEARFRALVQHSSHMVVVLDTAGGVTYASPAFQHALGYPAEARVVANLFDLVHPDDVKQVRLGFGEQLADPGAAGVFAFRALTASGSWLHLEAVGNNLLEDPSIGGIVLNARDVTERQHAEALLATQADVLDRITRAAPLTETLNVLAHMVERELQGASCALLLLDEGGSALSVAARPGMLDLDLPRADGLVAGAWGGCAGTAVHRRQPVFVADVATDPLYARARAAALASGLRAAWAQPVMAEGVQPRGVIAVYFDQPRHPGAGDRQLLELAARLAEVAIELSNAKGVLLAVPDPR